MITIHIEKKRSRFAHLLRPQIFAVFSYRFDHHLVADMIQNIRPIVDGWVSYDDRNSTELFSNENRRRRALLDAAITSGAKWILAVDPDERFEISCANRLHTIVGLRRNAAWSFNLRELYSPTTFRVDGIWGQKKQTRFFPAKPLENHNVSALHGQWFDPSNFEVKHSGLNIYHLKMIAPARRKGRRDLYATLDPKNQYQAIGYDYLTDEVDAQFEHISSGRHYDPVHVDDNNLWMSPLVQEIKFP